MKRLKLMFMTLLTIVVCGGFVSCSSDDDETYDSKGLVGVWYYDDDGRNYILNIKSNGTVAEYSESSYLAGEEAYDTGTWKLTNNILTFSYYGDEEYWQIVELSKDSVKLKYLGDDKNNEDDDEIGYIWTLHRYNK